MAIVEGVHVLVGAGFCSIFRAINVGLTQEWGAQRLVYCIDSPFWQTPCASKLAQQGELNHGQSLRASIPGTKWFCIGCRAAPYHVQHPGRHHVHEQHL